jgi:hypothetical protein
MGCSFYVQIDKSKSQIAAKQIGITFWAKQNMKSQCHLRITQYPN